MRLEYVNQNHLATNDFFLGGIFMALINVSNRTYGYEGSFDNIFENVSFSIDTNWKLGFVGRNGKGKPPFLICCWENIRIRER
jgi:ABC-type multidrug transport system fused ATPase/permease subunit